MASESRLLWIIFAVLVALIVVPLSLWRLSEARRPILEEVRIVTATEDDPVFRPGPRRVAPGAELRIAAALRIRQAGGSDLWLAPVDQLEIDGAPVEHINGRRWQEDDRVLRVFWFTVEGSYLGGDLTVDNAEKLLGQRPYLAPEMGRGLLAKTVPEQHNDDQINLGDEVYPVVGGTIRLYAKVEVAEKADSLAAEQAAASWGVDEVDNPDFTTIRMAALFPEPVSPVLGELFRLPGFEPQPAVSGSWDDITLDARGLTFTELVARRYVASSLTFASIAVTGGLEMDTAGLESLGRLSLNTDEPLRAGRPIKWGDDVRPGDLLVDRGQFIVLLADDGDGVLGLTDRVALCWRRPPVMTTLDQATRDDAVETELFRHGS
ncbi:MAG: hypothetical protein DRH30_08140 [Deltaproteobacteria bacterium]|nr:MAG: hypothetical protein DRH30_08140 [Deltaproteobacteria bacterium]